MKYLYITIILIAALVGTGISFIGMSGALMLWVGLFVCSLLDGFNTIGVWQLVIFLILAASSEIIEYISGVYGAKRFGASSRGVFGAVIGGIAGMVIFSAVLVGIGTIIGVLLGTFSGAFIGEYSLNIVAIGVKVLIILIITFISIIRYIRM
jgi:uncharacterized protein YqgC (DUF456 family)